MSDKGHTVQEYNVKTVRQKYGKARKMRQKLKEVQTKLMRGLLDLVVLQFLRSHPMHGYRIITSIRKNFGVYFGPSTIYPLLSELEEKGYLKSHWDLDAERPRKVYKLTAEGQSLLDCTENSLNLIHRKLSTLGIDKPSISEALQMNPFLTIKDSEDR
jgi:DNA-binding PadR family transcriptional regulator